MAELPSDIWLQISDFVQNRMLSYVCIKTWRTLHGHHIDCAMYEDHLGDMVGANRHALRTLRMQSRGALGYQGTAALATLRDATMLHTLHLSLANCGMDDSGAHTLAALRGCTTLHTLHLNLKLNRIGDAGVHSLAVLRVVPPPSPDYSLSLQTSTLKKQQLLDRSSVMTHHSFHTMSLTTLPLSHRVSVPCQTLTPRHCPLPHWHSPSLPLTMV